MKILSYYNKVINHIIKLYIKYFTIIMKLSYAYVIERYISERARVLSLKDIYSY